MLCPSAVVAQSFSAKRDMKNVTRFRLRSEKAARSNHDCAIVCFLPLRIPNRSFRNRPNTGIGRTTAGSRKRTFGATWLGQFRALFRPGPAIMEVKPHAPAVASSNAESPQRESAAVSAGR